MRFSGVIPAITTPFREDESIDHDGLARNVEGLIAAGVSGIVANGTMGEAHSLTRAERADVVATVVAAVEGRVPVTVGVSSESTRTSSEYAADARGSGADALMLLPPIAYEADQRELVAFYSTVAESGDRPMVLYNNPKASGSDLSPATIKAIAASVPHVRAVKECSADARRIAEIGYSGSELDVLIGGDDWALEGFCAGADGWISGVAVVAPSDCCQLYRACADGDLERARAVYARLLPLARLDMTSKLVQFFKAGQDAVGAVGGRCRMPRLALTGDERVLLDAALATLGAAAAA